MAGIDPDLTCDLNFCYFRLLTHVNSIDTEKLYECDPLTSRWGGRFYDYIAEWNTSHEVVLVPDLMQCLVDAREYATYDPFDFIWTNLETKIDSSLIDRMAKNWTLRYWYPHYGDWS